MKKLFVLAPWALIVATPAMAQVLPAADYVKTAGASDLYERQSAQIVLKTTTNPAIRSFATMMLTDHGKSTAMVKSAALKSRVKVAPAKLTPAQAQMIAELRTEAGTARDTTYVAQQKVAHGQALALQRAYATDGKAAPLKLAAAKIVPVVEHHIMMLEAM